MNKQQIINALREMQARNAEIMRMLTAGKSEEEILNYLKK